MHEASYTTKIHEGIEAVYAKMVDHTDCSWREDLQSVKQVDDDTFIETVIDGSTNTVRVLKRVPNECYEYMLESKSFNSHWKGTLKRLGDDETELTITEQLEFEKPLMKLVSRFLFKLERIHQVYARNLAWSFMDEEEDGAEAGGGEPEGAGPAAELPAADEAAEAAVPGGQMPAGR